MNAIEEGHAARVMLAALRTWICPGCGGRGHYHQNAKDTARKTERGAPLSPGYNPPPVPCKICQGAKLHPRASAAIATAEAAGIR